MAEQNDQRLHALSALIQLQSEARKAETSLELSFVIVNDVRIVLPGEQCFFWLFDELGRHRIKRAANVSDVDPNSTQVRWLEKLLGWCSSQPWHLESHKLTASDIPDELQSGWALHLNEKVLYVPMHSGSAGFLGGLLLGSNRSWLDGHLALADIIGETFTHAWGALQRSNKRSKLLAHVKHHWRRYLAAMLLLFALPVRQYVLASAEVVPIKPVIVAAPLSGTISDILVIPNQAVEQENVLFIMDDTELANRVILSRKSYQVAEAEYLKNAQASFGCDECLGRAAELKAVLQREQAKVDWATDLLERSRVKAPAVGIVVFSDENDWLGRPVNVGERVMMIADPEQTRIRIALTIEDAISIDPGAEVVFYPNSSPLSSFSAHITQTSYEAVMQADQTMAYPLLAGFDNESARLGLRGTAKIYGSRAPIIYLAMRKPVAWLRQFLGL